MDFFGIGRAELVFIFLKFVILVGCLLLALVALFSLRGRGLAGTALAVWVLIIVAVPFLGPVAYFVMRPHSVPDQTRPNPKATS